MIRSFAHMEALPVFLVVFVRFYQARKRIFLLRNAEIDQFIARTISPIVANLAA